MTVRVPKSPNNVTSTFFNTVYLVPEDLRFEYGGAKLAFCPGHHLTSLRPCVSRQLSNVQPSALQPFFSHGTLNSFPKFCGTPRPLI